MPRKMDNLTGKIFGRLSVISLNGRSQHGNILWNCVCECGTKLVVGGSHLRNSNTMSCGCLRKEVTAKQSTTHGKSKTPLYRVWRSMKDRCLNEHTSQYHDYGGRGIRICDEWFNYKPFYIWSMANGYRKGLTIDRINNDGNYEPSNCRWVSRSIQNNNKRNCHLLTHNGKTLNLQQWANSIGISRGSLRDRLKRMPIEKALTTPKMTCRRIVAVWCNHRHPAIYQGNG